MITKTWMRLALSAAAIAGLSGLPGAAMADDQPTLKIEVKEKLALTGTLTVPGTELKECTVDGFKNAFPVPSSFSAREK